MKPLVAKFNELKRAASIEINRLKQKIKDALVSSKVEHAKIAAAVDEGKEQISTMREELDRKSKMLASIKSSRSHDDSILQQVCILNKFIILIVLIENYYSGKLKQRTSTLSSNRLDKL